MLGLPRLAVNWFDEKAAHRLRLSLEETARCASATARSPSRGRLYPCERLIGEDRPEIRCGLRGMCKTAATSPPARSATARRSVFACAIQGQCNTTCRCNNYIRTGDVARPDALLSLGPGLFIVRRAVQLAKLLTPQTRGDGHGKNVT